MKITRFELASCTRFGVRTEIVADIRHFWVWIAKKATSTQLTSEWLYDFREQINSISGSLTLKVKAKEMIGL
jgi:hypothetical protein